MDKKDLVSLREAYQKVWENSHSEDKPCPCKDGKGVCEKEGCKCEDCEDVMASKEDKD